MKKKRSVYLAARMMRFLIFSFDWTDDISLRDDSNRFLLKTDIGAMLPFTAT